MVTEVAATSSCLLLGHGDLLRRGRKLHAPAEYICGPGGLGLSDLQQSSVGFDEPHEVEVRRSRVCDAVVKGMLVRTRVGGQEFGRELKPGRVDDRVRSDGTPVSEADLVALDTVDRRADVDESAPDRTGKR